MAVTSYGHGACVEPSIVLFRSPFQPTRRVFISIAFAPAISSHLHLTTSTALVARHSAVECRLIAVLVKAHTRPSLPPRWPHRRTCQTRRD